MESDTICPFVAGNGDASMRLTRVLPVVIGAALCLGAEAPALAEPLPSVPKFPIVDSPIALRGDVRHGQYLGAVGRAAAWLGTESGEAEVWAHPLKLAQRVRVDFRVPAYVDPISGAAVARTVETRPEIATITYTHATFTVRQHILAPLEEPGILLLFDVDSTGPLELVVSFQTVLQYAWPGALGGQYASWQDARKAFLLSESLRRHNAFIGSPWATTASSHPAHAMPDAPSTFVIPIDPLRARREFVPVAFLGTIGAREDAAARYDRLIANAAAIYAQRREHAARLRAATAQLTTPDARLNLALAWATVNLDEQLVCNPDLGCGLVAGWGPSGRGTRAGFGWFFGGDAAINSLAMSSLGLADQVATGLRFLAAFQRADGKIAHEISQAAGRIPWFTDYPYAYYHADTTPFWVLAVWRHWRATGDAALLGELWPNVLKAFAWGKTAETDGDGLIENTVAGLGAIEVGEIGADIHQDIYLAAVWLASLEATSEMAAARGEATVAREAADLARRGRETLNTRYWLPAERHHAFGLLRGGGTNPALTVWPATAASLGLLDAEPARQTLAQIAAPAMTTDWGVRMLAADHRLYAPTHYNMGAVWPFVSGFAAWAHYRYERPWAGFPIVDALARMTFDWARGRHPELLSGAFYRPLDTAVPHQFFATSMLVTPVMSGVVGWTPDAPRGRARLAPALPPSWDRVTVQRLRCGDARLDATIEQVPGALTVRLVASGPPLAVQVDPLLPPGSCDVRVSTGGGVSRTSVDAGVGIGSGPAGSPRSEGPGHDRVRPGISTRGTARQRCTGGPSPGAVREWITVGAQPVTVRITWRGGLVPAPVLTDLQPGQPSTGARITDFSWRDGAWWLTVAGAPGSAAEIDLHGVPVTTSGADLVERRGTVTRIRVTLPDADGPWSAREVTLTER